MAPRAETEVNKRNRLANLVCRELRHLLSTDGTVHNRNSEQLRHLLSGWMRCTGKVKYERP